MVYGALGVSSGLGAVGGVFGTVHDSFVVAGGWMLMLTGLDSPSAITSAVTLMPVGGNVTLHSTNILHFAAKISLAFGINLREQPSSALASSLPASPKWTRHFTPNSHIWNRSGLVLCTKPYGVWLGIALNGRQFFSQTA